jgi:FG-GAP repeat
VPELIHNRSGVGSHIVVADLNGDGMPDIVTAAIYGTFVFFNTAKPVRH